MDAHIFKLPLPPPPPPMSQLPPESFNRRNFNECLALVTQDGLNIRFVGRFGQIRMNLMHMAAVTQNGLALQYISKYYHTKRLCAAAVKQNPDAAQFILAIPCQSTIGKRCCRLSNCQVELRQPQTDTNTDTNTNTETTPEMKQMKLHLCGQHYMCYKNANLLHDD